MRRAAFFIPKITRRLRKSRKDRSAKGAGLPGFPSGLCAFCIFKKIAPRAEGWVTAGRLTDLQLNYIKPQRKCQQKIRKNVDIFHVFNLLLTYSFLLLLQKSIANRHAAWYNRLKEVRGGDFVVNMKTIGSAVVIILAAIVGLFLGAAMNDGLSGSILLAVIAGFVCVIYTIENSGKKQGIFYDFTV